MSFGDPISSKSVPADRFRDDHSVGFGRYRMFPALRLLLRDGQKIDLGARAFDVLWTLLEAGGKLVSKDELIDKVWAGAVVEENNLQAQMSAIRRALGPDRQMISTEFGRGYRLSIAAHASASLGGTSTEPIAPPELPYPVSALLGRASELDDVKRLIAEGRFVTITGPGGIGKTRLAIEVGRRLRALFADGVYLAEMAKIAERDLVWPAIETSLPAPSRLPAGTVGSPGAPHTAERCKGPVGRVHATLRDKHLLLIIDNCEHLAEPIAEAVEAVLQNARNLHILVTAQEPLGADGEHVYRLSPLAVPPADTQSAEAAMAHGAVQLFVERASASVHQFDFGDAVVGDVSAICRRLDGMPLALELAAARVSTLGLKGVLAGLIDRFKLLTAGRRTALPRHRTLRATVDWSHNLLDDEESRLFRRLSVFAAEFTADAARHVGGLEHDEPWQAIDLLSNLVAKSLLQSDLSGSVPRYRFLETIRFYALEKLADSGEVTPIGKRHAEFFARVAKQAAIDWKQLPTGDWRRSYQADIDDIRGALDWAFSPDGNEQTGVDILAHSTPFWIELSLHDECQRRLTPILKGGAIAPVIQPAQEMALQASLGTSLTWAKGPVAETRTAWTRALDLAHRISDSETQLQAHYGLWLYNLRCGRYTESLTHATQMMDLARDSKDREALAAGQRIMGVSRHFLGHHAEARHLIEAALRWYEQDRTVQAFRFGLNQHVAGLAYLARILWVQGFSGEAMETASAAVEKARAFDHASTLCCALAEGWCMVHALNGDDEMVEQATATLIVTASEHGLGFWKAYGDMFELWVAARRDAEAVPSDRLDNVIAVVKDIRFDVGYSTLLADILPAFRQAGRDAPILSILAAEFVTKANEDTHWAEPEFLRVGAKLASAGEPTAQEQLATALSLARRQCAPAWELKIAIDLAGALIKNDRLPEARAVLDPVLSAFPDGSRSTYWHIAQSMIAMLPNQ
jgi:predicted ATPase/DNA-binding winged helix-turn-helix (wHTH) protein